jgi:hypothetical protein
MIITHGLAKDHVHVEPVSEDVQVERNIAITKPTSFTLPTNTLVSHKSYHFTDRNVQAILSVRGAGVIRVGLTTTDPSLNQNVLEVSDLCLCYSVIPFMAVLENILIASTYY